MNRRLLDAHARQDSSILIDLYQQAADYAEASGQTDKACFYLTQSYVYALEVGSDQLDRIQSRLRQHGRI